ncbi:MAG: four helix bundle protein [Chitinophagaceae bacterium]|nr:four helix bundle protein [Chitinophagaceae bacterium]
MDYTLEKLEVYQLAEAFSDVIWGFVAGWKTFEKDTVGKQIVRAADSISANIAEGYGRFFYKESKQFYFYARGSIQETKSWLSKCKRRRLVPEEVCNQLLEDGEKILVKLNAYIKFVSRSPKHNDKTDQPIA